jgi:hypothetical protein
MCAARQAHDLARLARACFGPLSNGHFSHEITVDSSSSGQSNERRIDAGGVNAGLLGNT